MLDTALQCFQGASRCECDSDEEEWLIHYMLGKIAEKRKKAPVEYLQLYKKVKTEMSGRRCLEASVHVRQSAVIYLLRYITLTGCLCYQAAHYLHEEAARYPRKIHYHNPPDLAMEALEVSLLCSRLSVIPDNITYDYCVIREAFHCRFFV